MKAGCTGSLHIFTLSSFAIAQPVFDLLSRNAAFFVVRRSEPSDILILCALICVVLPLCLILIEKGVSSIAQGYQRYLGQVGLVDTLIGRLVSRLKAEGLYDRSLIVFTADHGVSFRPNQPRRLLTEENAPDIMRVPLFIKAPHQRDGVINDRNVETVDIVPTLADLLHVSLPWTVDGQSAFDSVRSEKKQKKIFAYSISHYLTRHVFDGVLPLTQNQKAGAVLDFDYERGSAG